MFGSSRKNRAPVQPLTKETANPNAATAAASAFMRREPSTSLSSAAAAAALKARPITPTNVADAQSKRTVRRSASVASTRSQDRNAGGGRHVRRTPSTSSMTERTFRSPSPGRSPAPLPRDVPPVPHLPRDQAQRPRSAYVPSTNIQTQPFVTASQKLKDGQQGSWFGGAKAGDKGNVRTADSVLQSAAIAATTVSEPRPGSISPSINFSYPRSRTESPAPSNASTSEVVMVYDANSRRMVPRVEKVDLIEKYHDVQAASEKPVKKKKHTVARSGSHLSKGTVGRTIEAPAETLQSVAPAAASQQTSSQLKVEANEAQHEQPVEYEATVAAAPALQSRKETPAEQSAQAPAAPSLAREVVPEPSEPVTVHESEAPIPAIESNHVPTLHKKPSTVMEDPEGEEETGSTTIAPGKSYDEIDAIPVRSSRVVQPAEKQQNQLGPMDPRVAAGSRIRVQSESPARSPGRAHFAATPDQLVVRHEPPPRSLSPRKSALKQSSSVRGASPSEDSSEASGPTSAFLRDDSVQARKKAARVSFNEDYNVVLGESAEPQENDSPVVLSPQAKHKPWRNFMNRNKKDSNSLEEDETMSPRPALPLFGSVREKKSKEPDSERPLVRPSDRIASPPPSSPNGHGTSTDSALGSILVQESATRNEANISKTREPLPPIVQSIEGSGYISSSTESSDDDDDTTHEPSQKTPASPSIATDITSPHVSQTEVTPEFVETQTDEKVVVTSPQSELPRQPANNQPALASSSGVESTDWSNFNAVKPGDTMEGQKGRVPSISVEAATPPSRHPIPDSPDREYFDVPGGFPTDQSSVGYSPSSEEGSPVVRKSVEVESVVSEPGPPPSPSRAEAGSGSAPMADIAEEAESDHSSIYSDAYEDLSDVGMDGFMSLDAVLEAPPKSQVSRLYEKTVTESKAQASSEGKMVPSDANDEPLKTPDDWEQAKAYWRGLTVEKRRQLEKEAIEEAGEEADQEAVSKPKKTKKRRSTDRHPSIADNEPSPSPDRTYQIQPGTSWVKDGTETSPPVEASSAKGFRKTLRKEQTSKVQKTQQPSEGMRKTMRSDGTANGTIGDLHGSILPPKRTVIAPRPISYHVATTVQPPQTTRRAQSSDSRPVSASGVPSPSVKPTLRRRGSDSSESSFKRTRGNTGEGFGFRRTMRSQSQEPESPRANTGSGRFSIRSLSPTGSAFRRSTGSPITSSMGGSRMRTSLRAAPSDAKDKSRFSTFGRSSGKKAKKDLGSRFADSSDEDEGGRQTFASSRFVDSSDEDEVPQAPMVNGGGLAGKTMRQPKPASSQNGGGIRLGRQVRSDSPDLPDSDDDVAQIGPGSLPNGQSRPGVIRSRSGRGSLTGAAPAVLNNQGVGERPSHQRRGSFMSSILRRKKDTGSKISRDTSESLARRDTALERSTDELAVIRSNTSAGRPRLQKRGPSWPLPEPDEEGGGNHAVTPSSPAAVPERPATSSGHGATAPRGFLKRRSLSAQQVPPVPPIPGAPKSQVSEVPPERSQMTEVPPDAALKKKKFGTLRKIFGLND